ncbi:hypothetical protein ACLB2K_066716 [Fragaria x ananassa]
MEGTSSLIACWPEVTVGKIAHGSYWRVLVLVDLRRWWNIGTQWTVDAWIANEVAVMLIQDANAAQNQAKLVYLELAIVSNVGLFALLWSFSPFGSVLSLEVEVVKPSQSPRESFSSQSRLFLFRQLIRKMAWRQILFHTRAILTPHSTTGLARFSTKSTPYLEKVGIPEFLNGIGKGVEAHVAKIESEIGDIQKLLVTRTLRLKKLGIPVKQRKLILKYTHKYRLGLWRPLARPMKS